MILPLKVANYSHNLVFYSYKNIGRQGKGAGVVMIGVCRRLCYTRCKPAGYAIFHADCGKVLSAHLGLRYIALRLYNYYRPL